MGVDRLWPFLQKKGYNPLPQHPSAPPHHTIRIDVLGALYANIRRAYSRSPELGHPILENAVAKFGAKDNIVLYLDGVPSKEKETTHRQRCLRRNKALQLADKHLDELSQRIELGARVRKRHFVNVRKTLAAAFHWALEDRRSFAAYMNERQWNVVLSSTEADLSISIDYQPGDIAVSKDSDLLVYGNIENIWRPISRDRVLAYHIPDVLVTLGLTRGQFTALGVVSKNDYDTNIASLGPESNFTIIKNLVGMGRCLQPQLFI